MCVCCAGSVDKLQSNITDDAGVGLALETLMVIFICIFFACIQSDQLQMSHFCFLPQPHTNLTGQNLIHTHTFSRARALSLSLSQGPETNRVFVAGIRRGSPAADSNISVGDLLLKIDGNQFTCFTGTKVQILTQKALQGTNSTRPTLLATPLHSCR